MLEFIRQIRWQDALDVSIITFLIYRALQIVRGSRAMQMIIGLAVIFIDQLKVENWMAFAGCVAIVVGAYAAAQASILIKAK